jgi:hypothetical protein
MVFNATFNNISDVSWWSVLLVEDKTIEVVTKTGLTVYVRKHAILQIFLHLAKSTKKLEKKYAPALHNYGQSCFVWSDFLKMKCICKTQMMPPPDHKKI